MDTYITPLQLMNYSTPMDQNYSIPLQESCSDPYAVAFACHKLYRNSNVILMEQCFLSQCFIPQTLSAQTVVPLTASYLVIFICGILGNFCTCVVISQHPALQSNTSKYLLNLAVADLITLLAGIPFEIYLLWNQYPWQPPDFVCNFRAWALETTSYVSVLTILTFSIERYVAICHTFLIRRLSAYDNYLPYVFLLLWLVAAICAVPYGIYHKADYIFKFWEPEPSYGSLKQSKMCMLALAFDPGLMNTFNILFHVSAVAYFALPLLLLVCLYARLGLVAHRTRRVVRKISQNSNKQDFKSGKVLKILISVVAVFFSCYAPYQIQRLIFFYINNDSGLHAEINEYLYIISGILFYLSCIINPILYNLISSKYRKAFRDVLYCTVEDGRKSTHRENSVRQCLLKRSVKNTYSTTSKRHLV